MKLQDVAFAELDFQGTVRPGNALAPVVAEVACTQAFPEKGPISLAAAADYQGLKLFPAGNHFCIAYFHNAGREDDYGRAVPSARLLALPAHVSLDPMRYLAAVRDFLQCTDFATQADPAGALAACLGDQEADREEVLRTCLAAAPLPAERLAVVLARVASQRRLLIGGRNAAARLALFDLLFLLLPEIAIRTMSWCTYADRPGAEDIHCFGLQVAPAPKGLAGWFRGKPARSGPDSHPAIDLESGNTTGFEKPGQQEQRISRIFLELLAGKLLAEQSLLFRHALMLAFSA